MVVQKLHLYFNLLLDKFGSPYFTDEEVDVFLNAGQNELYQQYFPDNEDYLYNIELNQHTLNVFNKLIDTKSIEPEVQVDPETSEESVIPIKQILYVDIDSIREVSRILNVITEDDEVVSFMRYNDLAKASQNDFLKPDGNIYYFKFIKEGIEIIPSSDKNILITYIKEPLEINKGTNQTSELASFLHYDLVVEAINKAGVATRDEAMAQLNQI